jgi:putative colanic acid biosynthesis acetyltransferase WcaF
MGFQMTVLDAVESDPLHGGPSFKFGSRAYRMLWTITWLLLASWTPPSFRLWRIFLLRCFGADVASTASIRGSSKVWAPYFLVMGEHSCLGPNVICYDMARILIDDGAIVSQRAFLCAGSHAIDDPNFQLIAKPIRIGRNAWVAAEAFVGPGVSVGDGAVLGARAVAFENLDPWCVYVGNPAMKTRKRVGGPQ